METDLGEDQPLSRYSNDGQEIMSLDLLGRTSIQENESHSPITYNLSQSDQMQQQQVNQHNVEEDEIQLNCKQLEGMDSHPEPWYMHHEHQPHLLQSYPYGKHLNCRQLPDAGYPSYTQEQLADTLNSNPYWGHNPERSPTDLRNARHLPDTGFPFNTKD